MRTLRNGAYTLPEPAEIGDLQIPNPAADGRKRNDWRAAPTFKPGTYFVSTFEHKGEFPYVEITVRRLHGYGLTIGKRNHDDFAPLLDALVVDDSLDSLLRYEASEHYVDPIDLLVRLVDAGVLSKDAVRVAVAAQREVDELADD